MMLGIQRRQRSVPHYSNQLKKKIKHFSYGINDNIGKGYSSIVYKGTNQLNIVAIKAISMSGVKDSVSRQMLDCEIQALTKLKHPNILKCFDVIRESSHCYIVTQFCGDGDLSKYLKKKRRIDQQEVTKFMKDIISGFVYLAQNNFLHRDLKLANIFLSNGRAVIADFGFAKKHFNVFEKEKYNVGSPLYMSPEALKKNIYSVKNDIWSIGIMIYEMLYGETPWQCRTQKQLMQKMVKIPVKFREDIKVSSDIKKFIKKCLQVNEDERMNLNELREWNKANNYENLTKGQMYLPSVPELNKKPNSSETPNNGPLGQVTNRISSKSQSNINYHSKSTKEVSSKQNISIGALQKQQTKLLSRNVLEKNNNILILEINVFRLLFKIYEKVKKYSGDQRQLLNCIGNQVLKRVNNLMGFICPDKQNEGSFKGYDYGLSDTKLYLDEQTNGSIKKYKSVIKEYYNKYNKQIKMNPLGRQITTKQLIKEKLSKGTVMKDNLNNEEMIMIYWMIQFAQLTPQIKKQYLDGVIDPKNQNLSKSYLENRIKNI